MSEPVAWALFGVIAYGLYVAERELTRIVGILRTIEYLLRKRQD